MKKEFLMSIMSINNYCSTRKTHTFFLFFILLFLFISCNSEHKYSSIANKIAFYHIMLPDKQKGYNFDIPQVISLDTNKNVHKLDFGVFSTESAIEIFQPDEPGKSLIYQHLNPNEKQIIDITKLGKGIYKVNFTAIAESCIFPIEIK